MRVGAGRGVIVRRLVPFVEASGSVGLQDRRIFSIGPSGKSNAKEGPRAEGEGMRAKRRDEGGGMRDEKARAIPNVR